MRGLIGAGLIAWLYGRFRRLEQVIMATQAENQAAVDAVAAQLGKAKAEILAQIDALEAAANSGQTLNFDALRSEAQGLDDINLDPPAEPAPEPEPATPEETPPAA